jgi:hypothetical protein
MACQKLVGDVARRQDDVQVTLGDWKGERIVESSSVSESLSGLRDGWDDRSVRARGPAGGGVIKAQEPRAHRHGEFVSNVELGQELLLELVSVPLQLGTA